MSVTQAGAFARGWQPAKEQAKMSESIPFRVGAGKSSQSALAAAVQAAGWSGVGSYDFNRMSQSQFNSFINQILSGGTSPQDSRLQSVVSAAKSMGLSASLPSAGPSSGPSSSSSSSSPSSSSTSAPVDNSAQIAWQQAQAEAQQQAQQQQAQQAAAQLAWEQQVEAQRQAAEKAYQDQQIAIQQRQAQIAQQQADQQAKVQADALAYQQQQDAQAKQMKDAADAAEAKRVADEKAAYDAAHAPRWVQEPSSRFDPSRSPVAGAQGTDVVTLPDGRQMTRDQAYQRGWGVTTTPGDYGASQDQLGQKTTVFLQVQPSQMAAVRQYVAQQGGQVGAAYGGQLQVIAPAGAIDKLWDIPGVQIFQGSGGGSTASTYLPSGYDVSTGTTPQEQTQQIRGPQIATDTVQTGFEEAPADTSGMRGSGQIAQQPVQNNTADATGSQLAQGMTQGQNATSSVGSQLAQNMGAPATQGTSGWGSFAPILNAPPIPDWNTWQNMTPFEKASYRVLAESAGPWEQQQQKMREQWAGEGITNTPNQTRLTAATMAPRDVLGLNFTADTFGEKPDDFWQRQSKTWSQADTGNTSIAAGGLGIRTRQAVLGR